MEIRKGNYKVFNFQRIDSGGQVIKTQPDEVYFTVKKDVYTEKAIIQKQLKKGIEINQEGLYSIILQPEDTENMDYGKYVYDIKIIEENKPKTIKVDSFFVKEIVNFNSNEV